MAAHDNRLIDRKSPSSGIVFGFQPSRYRDSAPRMRYLSIAARYPHNDRIR